MDCPDLERLDKAFRKTCASEAREYRKSYYIALKQGGLAYAIEQQAKAEVWDTLAEVGLPVLVKIFPPPPPPPRGKRKKAAK
jgi:hypothetical protein